MHIILFYCEFIEAATALSQIFHVAGDICFLCVGDHILNNLAQILLTLSARESTYLTSQGPLLAIPPEFSDENKYCLSLIACAH